MINLARTLSRSTVNGPGERFVVWVQGCSLRCPGCWNPDTWRPGAGTSVRARFLSQRILATRGIDGVTLTGGEPFEQAAALIPLVTRVRAAGLSVMVFTGYRRDELRAAEQRELLSLCDIAVMGRYQRARRTLDAPWRGSSNQTVHFLSPRHDSTALPSASECEVHISPDGSMTLTGFPPAELCRPGDE